MPAPSEVCSQRHGHCAVMRCAAKLRPVMPQERETLWVVLQQAPLWAEQRRKD